MKNKKIIMYIVLAILAILLIIGGYFFIKSKDVILYSKENATAANTLSKLENLKYMTEKTLYTDANGDTAIIPKDFAVSTRENENVINNGLVILDKNLNEYVYIKDENNGFYISRFEIGTPSHLEVGGLKNMPEVYSKQNMFPVTYIEMQDIENLISKLDNENITYTIPTLEDYNKILKFTGIDCREVTETEEIKKYVHEPMLKTGVNKSTFNKNISDISANIFEVISKSDFSTFGGEIKLKGDPNNATFIGFRLVLNVK